MQFPNWDVVWYVRISRFGQKDFTNRGERKRNLTQITVSGFVWTAFIYIWSAASSVRYVISPTLENDIKGFGVMILHSSRLGRAAGQVKHNIFSWSSSCLLGQHGSCSSSQLPVELSENMLQNLFLNLPPQSVQGSRIRLVRGLVNFVPALA